MEDDEKIILVNERNNAKNKYKLNNDYITDEEEEVVNEVNKFYRNPLFIILVLVLMTILLISERMYRKQSFDYSVKVIESIHKENKKDSTLFSFATFISDLLTENTVIVLSVLIFSFFNIKKSVYFIFIAINQEVFNDFLKIIYQSPRPLWMSESIHSLYCEKGYGNPSGHAMGSTIIALALYEVVVGQNRLFKNKNLWKMGFFIFTLLLILFISVSRVILGVHSINQIVYGVLLGFFFYFVFTYYVFNNNLNRIGKEEDYNFFDVLLYTSNDRKDKTTYTGLFIFTGITLAFNITCVILFLTLRNPEKDANYILKIDEHCPNLNKPQRLLPKCLLHTFLTFSLLGMYLGLVLHNKYFAEDESREGFLKENFDCKSLKEERIYNQESKSWNDTVWWVSIIRFIVLLFLFGIMALVLKEMIPKSNISEQEYKRLSPIEKASLNFTFVDLLHFILPGFIIFFVLFFFLRPFMKTLNLAYNEERDSKHAIQKTKRKQINNNEFVKDESSSDDRRNNVNGIDSETELK